MRLPAILHEDDQLLVVDRPAGVPLRADGPYAQEGLQDWVARRLGLGPGLAPHPAVPSGAPGVLLFTKTPAAARCVAAQLGRGEVRWTVRALLPAPALERLGPAGAVRPGPGRIAFTRLERRDDLALVEGVVVDQAALEPFSSQAGRDPVAPPVPPTPGRPASGPMLHLVRIELTHPGTGRPVSVEATGSALFQAVLEGERRPARCLALGALEARRGLTDLSETTALRLLNGASDGAPGQFVDRLGQALLFSYRVRLDRELVDAMREATGIETVYCRELRRDVRGAGARQARPLHLAGPAVGDRFLVLENGLRFQVSVHEGYSVGLFLDQRETRWRILRGEWLPDRTGCGAGGGEAVPATSQPEALNLFAFTGAFSVAAARAGARVTTVDLSRRYLEWARQNMEANGLESHLHTWLVGDAFDWMRRLARKGRSFDLVVVDPPTFSTSKASGPFSAVRDYGRLALRALPLVRPGGTLVACTNAATLAPHTFRQHLLAACRQLGRTVVSESLTTQPLDFPASAQEPAYLKVWWADLGT
ncbi:MAG: class I SAM-dependent methyltransferase [Candidatus Riflebacteria bacterium]|nr:class I SAM-dependent methyltransferase [Candidatus Riflebacteria bacterium]